MTTSVLQDKAAQLRELVEERAVLSVAFSNLADRANELQLLLDQNKLSRIRNESQVRGVDALIAEVKTVMRELIDAGE